jgi:hypothetical protein
MLKSFLKTYTRLNQFFLKILIKLYKYYIICKLLYNLKNIK